MEDNKKQLFKHFAGVLRNKANPKEEELGEISNIHLKFLNRKELIEVVKKVHLGSIPKEYNLIEMENEEILKLIGDEMFILAHFTDKWSKEKPTEVKKEEIKRTIVKFPNQNKNNEKKETISKSSKSN